MERCALVFGVRVPDLLRGEGQSAPLAMLFKRLGPSPVDSGHQRLVELDRSLGLSRFSRAAYDVFELRRLDEAPASRLPDLRSRYEVRPSETNPGDFLAREARQALGRDATAPIASMRQLLEAAGVLVLFADEEELDRRIIGVSLSHPLPAVLVRSSRHPWVIRMTLAHELGHLLYHRAEGLAVNQDPHTGASEILGESERQADAFAAAFLVPSLGLQERLQGTRPDSSEAVQAIGAQFGVGWEVAVNRIVDCFNLGESVRRRLLTERRSWRFAFPDDVVAERDIGIVNGTVRNLVAKLHAAGRVSTVKARAILDLSDTETVEGSSPSDGQEAIRARLRAQIQRAVAARGTAAIVASVEQTATGWNAELVDLVGRAFATARVSNTGDLIDVVERPA
jgi:Zn-dependent peptidase ImmA (M78 family)